MNTCNRIFKLFIASAIATFVIIATSVPALAATKHNVSFVYGTKVYTTSVKDGETVTPPIDTYVPGYVFAGWVGSSINVKSDVVILGAYVPVAPVYTPVYYPVWYPSNSSIPSTNEVRFLDSVTGQIYNTQIVERGRSAVEPEKPVHSGYHFARYDGDFIDVRGPVTVVAVYHRDNSNCECDMYARIENEKKAEQERLRLLKEKEDAEREEMLLKVQKEKEAEQEMLNQLREKEAAEKEAELLRQQKEKEAEEEMLRQLREREGH